MERHFIGRMLRKVWRRHTLGVSTMLKLGRYYKSLLQITVEEELDHEDLPEPSKEPIFALEDEFPIKADLYQTASTAFTELYVSEQAVLDVFLFEFKVEPLIVIGSLEIWTQRELGNPTFPDINDLDSRDVVEQKDDELPQNNSEPSGNTVIQVDEIIIDPVAFLPEEIEQPVSQNETFDDSCSEEIKPHEFDKPSPPNPRRSLRAIMDTKSWDQQAWIHAYRRMSSVVIPPRPPIESQEHLLTVYETDAMWVAYRVPPLLGFFGVDYDDTWNRAARVIQRLFKKGYFLKLIAKVTRMNRELKKAEEITQNRKRRRLALKMHPDASQLPHS